MSIISKLAEIMKEVSYVQKDLQVSYGSTNYKAATERAVLNAVRPKLVEKNLIIIPYDGTAETHETNKGAMITTVTAKYQLFDAESGESMMLWSTGQGHDSSDKGAGKAFTYATKYLLLKMFLLETGDDPDVNASDENVAADEKDAAAPLYKELVEMVDLAEAAGNISADGAQRTKDRLKEARNDLTRLKTAKSRIANL